MALVYCYGDNPLADAHAKEAAEILVATYPNHSWWVECKQGVLIIKHMEASGARGLIGMLRRVADLANDANARKRDIVRAAGELLERARLARGPRDDTPVRSMDLRDTNLAGFWTPPGVILR